MISKRWTLLGYTVRLSIWKERTQTVLKSHIHPYDVISNVALHFKVPVESVLGNSRITKYKLARWECWRILRDENKMTFSEIGYLFNKHHTTIMHGISKLNREYYDK